MHTLLLPHAGLSKRQNEAHKAEELHPLDPWAWGVETWLAVIGAAVLAMRYFCKLCRYARDYVKAWLMLPILTHETRQEVWQLRQMLTLSRGRSRALMDTMPNPIWESNSEGDCTFANRRMLEVLNVGFEQVSGKAWEQRIHPDDRERVYEAWYQAVENKTDFELSYRWVDAHNKPVPIAVVCRRIFDEANSVLGWIANVTVLPP